MMTKENITPGQLTKIKTMLGKLKIKDKDAMVQGFTQWRTTHVSGMYKDEAGQMIRELMKLDPNEKSAELMRRKLIAMAYKVKGLGPRATTDEKKEAIKALDEWCKTYGHQKKPMDSYTYEELPTLVTQYEKRVNSLLKGI